MRTWLVAISVALLVAGSAPGERADARMPDLTGRQILEFDAAGGRLVEAFGDVAAAERIAVIVPGADTSVANFHSGHGGLARRSPAWQAQRLAAAAGPDTAVIAWLGYRPPEGIGPAAITSGRAADGADALVAFVAELVEDRPAATFTLIGHSYGSVVLGHAAARLPAAVTDLVSVGSPGMDVASAAELDTAARVWAGSAPDDWTLRLPDLRLLGMGHGVNPTRPRFGALPLDVDGAVGHDGYFVPGTDSLRSLAAITASAPPG